MYAYKSIRKIVKTNKSNKTADKCPLFFVVFKNIFVESGGKLLTIP